jgi:hypothetical protein
MYQKFSNILEEDTNNVYIPESEPRAGNQAAEGKRNCGENQKR